MGCDTSNGTSCVSYVVHIWYAFYGCVHVYVHFEYAGLSRLVSCAKNVLRLGWGGVGCVNEIFFPLCNLWYAWLVCHVQGLRPHWQSWAMPRGGCLPCPWGVSLILHCRWSRPYYHESTTAPRWLNHGVVVTSPHAAGIQNRKTTLHAAVIRRKIVVAKFIFHRSAQVFGMHHKSNSTIDMHFMLQYRVNIGVRL